MAISDQLENAERIRDDFDDAEREVTSAEMSVEWANSALSTARAHLAMADPDDPSYGALRSQVALYESQAASAQAQLTSAQSRLSSVRARRDQAIQQVNSFMEQEDSALAQLARAASVSRFARAGVDNAQEEIRRSMQVGERALTALGASWGRGIGHGAGGLAGVGVGRGTVPLESVAIGDRNALGDGGGAHATRVGTDVSTSRAEAVPGSVGQLSSHGGQESAIVGAVTSSASFVSPEGAGPTLASSSMAVPGVNDNAERDANAALSHLETTHSPGSALWSEAASRELDMLETRRASLVERSDDADCRSMELRQQVLEMQASSSGEPLSLEQHQKMYQLASASAAAAREARNIRGEISGIGMRINELTAILPQSSRTTLVTAPGCDFVSAYDGFITAYQGDAYPNVEGCCGIGVTGSAINRLTGATGGWSTYIDSFKNEVPPQMEYYGPKHAESNGGTTVENRFYMAHKAGLACVRLESGKGVPRSECVTLDELSARLNRGDFIGLTIKAEDLEGDTLSRRSINPRTLWSNHAVSVAAVSHDANGRASGVWINDTGGWGASNRVFITRDKFEAMRDETIGFGAEFFRRQ